MDTAPDVLGTLNALLTKEGLPPANLAAARSLIGRGGRAMVARGFAAAGRPLSEPELAVRFEAFSVHYRAHLADLSTPFPGVEDCLATLTAAGARLAVCTNKRGEFSDALLAAVGIGRYFAAVVGPDRAPAPKPDPRHLLAAIEVAGGKPERAVMVGDSETDAKAAHAAGIPLVLVDFGYTDIPVSELGADRVISDFAALPQACADLLGRRFPR